MENIINMLEEIKLDEERRFIDDALFKFKNDVYSKDDPLIRECSPEKHLAKIDELNMAIDVLRDARNAFKVS